jgi:hypothetical protein
LPHISPIQIIAGQIGTAHPDWLVFPTDASHEWMQAGRLSLVGYSNWAGAGCDDRPIREPNPLAAVFLE